MPTMSGARRTSDPIPIAGRRPTTPVAERGSTPGSGATPGAARTPDTAAPPVSRAAYAVASIGPPPFVARRGSVLRLIDPRSVHRVTGAGNYARLHCDGGEHLVRETLVDVEERLRPLGLVRVHRSTLVRISDIRELRATRSGYTAVMNDGTEVRVSRGGCARLSELLGVRI